MREFCNVFRRKTAESFVSYPKQLDAYPLFNRKQVEVDKIGSDIVQFFHPSDKSEI